jgi:hypothetical protein
MDWAPERRTRFPGRQLRTPESNEIVAPLGTGISENLGGPVTMSGPWRSAACRHTYPPRRGVTHPFGADGSEDLVGAEGCLRGKGHGGPVWPPGRLSAPRMGREFPSSQRIAPGEPDETVRIAGFALRDRGPGGESCRGLRVSGQLRGGCVGAGEWPAPNGPHHGSSSSQIFARELSRIGESGSHRLRLSRRVAAFRAQRSRCLRLSGSTGSNARARDAPLILQPHLLQESSPARIAVEGV